MKAAASHDHEPHRHPYELARRIPDVKLERRYRIAAQDPLVQRRAFTQASADGIPGFDQLVKGLGDDALATEAEESLGGPVADQREIASVGREDRMAGGLYDFENIFQSGSLFKRIRALELSRNPGPVRMIISKTLSISTADPPLLRSPA